MSNKSIAILLILVAAASAGVTRYFFPQLEFKNVEVVKEVVKTDVHTVTRIIERPDGTKETTTDTTDHSTKSETSKNETIIAAKHQWMFDVGARANLDKEIFYDAHAQRRILGPFFLGVRASTDKTVGVSVGMEF